MDAKFKWLCEEIKLARYDYQRLVKELHDMIEEMNFDKGDKKV